jgi:hypothetical protein
MYLLKCAAGGRTHLVYSVQSIVFSSISITYIVFLKACLAGGLRCSQLEWAIPAEVGEEGIGSNAKAHIPLLTYNYLHTCCPIRGAIPTW